MILIPAHNEAASIARVVREARRHCDAPVVVIDDASTDGTADLACAAGAILLPLRIRLGAWGAIQTGLKLAEQEGWPLAVTMDADGQHEAAHVAKLLAPIQAGEADVVIGACPARASPPRWLAWRYFRWLTGIPLEDITSGFRAYNRAAIQRLTRADASLLDYQDVGVIMLLNRHGLRLREVAVPMQSREDGPSRIFGSRWAVTRYMLHTSLLCLAQLGRRESESDGN